MQCDSGNGGTIAHSVLGRFLQSRTWKYLSHTRYLFPDSQFSGRCGHFGRARTLELVSSLGWNPCGMDPQIQSRCGYLAHQLCRLHSSIWSLRCQFCPSQSTECLVRHGNYGLLSQVHSTLAHLAISRKSYFGNYLQCSWRESRISRKIAAGPRSVGNEDNQQQQKCCRRRTKDQGQWTIGVLCRQNYLGQGF